MSTSSSTVMRPGSGDDLVSSLDGTGSWAREGHPGRFASCSAAPGMSAKENGSSGRLLVPTGLSEKGTSGQITVATSSVVGALRPSSTLTRPRAGP